MPTGDGGGGDLAGGRHTMWSWAPPYIAIGAFVLSVTTSVASAEPVALTFDDLPTLALDHSPRYSQITTERLIRGLHRQHQHRRTTQTVDLRPADFCHQPRRVSCSDGNRRESFVAIAPFTFVLGRGVGLFSVAG